MISLNRVMLIGRLGADPEVRYTPEGTPVANFSVATSQRVKKGDRWEEGEPDWHRIVAWDRLAEICSEYLNKGSRIYVEGRLRTRSWEDQEGNRKYRTEILARNLIMLDSRSSETEASKATEEEDDIPF